MNWVQGGPWQRREVVWPSVRILAGLFGIVVAWYGASDTLDWSDGTVWVAVGSIALIVSLSGVAGWIKVGLRNVRHLERLLLGTARAQFAGAASSIRSDLSEHQVSGGLVVVPGATLIHRADCLLVAGKATAAATAGARLDNCGMCEPA